MVPTTSEADPAAMLCGGFSCPAQVVCVCNMSVGSRGSPQPVKLILCMCLHSFVTYESMLVLFLSRWI